MQVDPQGAGAGTLVLARPDGGELSLDVGRTVVARVVSTDPSTGTAQINLAGQTVSVQTALPVTRGDVLQLTVVQNQGTTLSLSITGSDSGIQPAPAAQSPLASMPPVSRALAEFAPAALRELARAGVAVTPDAVQTLARAIEQAVAGGQSVDTAARSFATLVGRGLALDPSVGQRVGATLDAAGNLGRMLGSLAAKDAGVATALQNLQLNPESLRSLTSPSLSQLESGLARVAAAIAAAQRGGAANAAVAASSTSATTAPTVAQAAVASTIATQSAVGQLADAALTSRGPASLPALPGANPSLAPPDTQQPSALRAALTGAAAEGGPRAATTGSTGVGAQQAPLASSALASTAAGRAAAANPALVTSGAAATPMPLAQAVADTAVGMARFLNAFAPSEGVLGQAAATLGRPGSGQAAAVAGSYLPVAAGGQGAGDQAALVPAVRAALLDALGAHGDAAPQLARLVSAAAAGDAAAARQLTSQLAAAPPGANLLAAGRLLEALPGLIAQGLAPAHAAELRQLAHQILLAAGDPAQPTTADIHALRSALEQAATSGTSDDVRQDAQRILQAMDGQHIISQPKIGMDPGYVYLQLPLPGNRSAEVMVKREPGRRAVSFEQFDVAFLLDTESLGPLLIHLDAHPAAVRATIKTERPAFLPLLEAQADDLRGPLEREANRPVHVNVGTFGEAGAPPSLLTPELGLQPGENSYYA